MAISTLPLDKLLESTDAADHSSRRALSDVSRSIAKCKRAVVISGAGISCSSGIPDFRSADGLYSLVKSRYPEAFVSGKELFSSGLFTNPATTSLFYTFIAELTASCQNAEPTKTHHFIAKLANKGKLLRSYTQNIDGLERRLGLESGGRGKGLSKKWTKNVEMHGDLGRVRCVLCMTDYAAKEEWTEMFREGEAPDCPACEERCSSRLKRSARAIPVGTLRPSIVLYDEPHPLGEDIGSLQAYDLYRSPDLLLIMGTSLKVHGLKKVVKAFSKAVHARNGLVVFVNATPPSKEWEGVIDVHVHGHTDTWVERVEEEWRKIKPQDWEIQTKLDGDMAVIKEAKLNLKGKQKAEGPKKAQRPAANKEKENQPESVQLPTPRPSLSPGQVRSSPRKADVPSPRPPTPVSPSKRRINMPPSPVSEAGSPTKRRMMEHNQNTTIPSTGVPGTPGRGNLFTSPSKSHSVVLESSSIGFDHEVFGSPAKIPAKPKIAGNKKGVKSKSTRTSSSKENIKPDLQSKATRATKPRGVRDRQASQVNCLG